MASWAGWNARFSRKVSYLQDAVERILGRNALWAVFFVLLLTPILSQQSCSLPEPTYSVGEVAAVDIKAPNDIELLDEDATRQRREVEREKVPPVYDLVVGLFATERGRIQDLFEAGRAALKRTGQAPPADGRRAPRMEGEDLARLRTALPVFVPDEALGVLAAHGFSERLQEAALVSHAAALQGKVVSHKVGLHAPEEAIIIREVGPGALRESPFTRVSQIRDWEEARAALKSRLEAEAPELKAAERDAVEQFLESFVVPNLSYNASETERRRAQAMASVEHVFTRVPRGRMIVREGEVFTPETLDLLMRIRRVEPAAINWRGLAGNALVLTLMALFLFRYVQAHQKNFHRVKNLYTMALTSMIMTTVGSWVGLFIARSVADQYVTPPFNDATAYIWALPVCAGAMLITLLANDRFATVCSAFTAVVFGIVMSWNAQAMVFALLSSFAAIYGVRKYGKRTAILKAGFLVGLLNATTVLALQCIKSAPPPASQVLFEIAAAFAGGLLAVPVASFGLPIMEWLFNALTDIRLLELSNLDNPLLRRLSLEAPGVGALFMVNSRLSGRLRFRHTLFKSARAAAHGGLLMPRSQPHPTSGTEYQMT